VAKGVGERAKQPKGLILAAGRDTVAERDCRDEHHGRDVSSIKNEVMCDFVR
jgi:hypothetical protein